MKQSEQNSNNHPQGEIRNEIERKGMNTPSQRKDAIDPMIPVRLKPNLPLEKLLHPTPDCFEDDERIIIQEEVPEGLTAPMEFFEPRSDKFSPEYDPAVFEEYGIKVDITYEQEEQLPEDTIVVVPDTGNLPSVVGGIAETLFDQSVPETYSHNIRQPKSMSGYEIADMFRLVKNVRVFNNCLYIFNGASYEYTSMEDAKIIIFDQCRHEIKKTRKPSMAEEVYKVLLQTSEIQVDSDKKDESLIAFQNAVLDSKTGELNNPSPDMFVTFRLKCNYVGDLSYSPWFDNLLSYISGGDAMLTKRIWEVIGYCLTPDTSAKSIFVFQGAANSGKSLLTTIIESFFPEDNVTSTNIHELSQTFALSDLIGKALCVSPDLPSGRLDSKAVSVLKQLTGNDLVSANIKYHPPVKFRCRARFILATNHPILLYSKDKAFFERLVVVPFNNPVPKERRNSNLIKLISSKKTAIAAKALRAYYELVRNKYRFSGSYRVNEMQLADEGTEMVDFDGQVLNFLIKHVERRDDGRLHVEDLHQMFQCEYGECSIADFSKHATPIIKQLYGAEKGRKRKDDGDNAQSCYLGISLKQNIEN